LLKSDFDIEIDTVIMSLGTSPNPLISSTTKNLDVNKWGCLITEGESGLTTRQGVFAGGDAEQQGTEVLRRKEFVVTVDLGLGDGRATVYTSDLSHEYVSINADYRT